MPTVPVVARVMAPILVQTSAVTDKVTPDGGVDGIKSNTCRFRLIAGALRDFCRPILVTCAARPDDTLEQLCCFVHAFHAALFFCYSVMGRDVSLLTPHVHVHVRHGLL